MPCVVCCLSFCAPSIELGARRLGPQWSFKSMIKLILYRSQFCTDRAQAHVIQLASINAWARAIKRVRAAVGPHPPTHYSRTLTLTPYVRSSTRISWGKIAVSK